MRWLWWLLGLGVVGGVGYWIVSSRTGERIPAGTACVTDLDDASRKHVSEAVVAGDVAALTALGASFDANGWTCAATEVRAAALRAKMAAGIDDVPEPRRFAWKKLIDRALSEADPDGDLVASLERAAADAAKDGYAKVRDVLHDAARDVRRTMWLVKITEEPPKKDIDAALVAARGESTKATVDMLRALSKQLASLGYDGAANEADETADAVQEKLDAVAKAASLGLSPSTAEFGPVSSDIGMPVKLPCQREIDALPDAEAPYSITMSDGYGYRPISVRSYVTDAVKKGVRDDVLWVAEFLRLTSIAGGGSAYADAALCLRLHGESLPKTEAERLMEETREAGGLGALRL